MNTAPTTYAIRVDGHLDDHWSAWLGELDITRNDDGTTTILASIADQAQLHGVLAGLRDIGAVITELRTTGAAVSTASQLRRPRRPTKFAAAGPHHRYGTTGPEAPTAGEQSELEKRPGPLCAEGDCGKALRALRS